MEPVSTSEVYKHGKPCSNPCHDGRPPRSIQQSSPFSDSVPNAIPLQPATPCSHPTQQASHDWELSSESAILSTPYDTNFEAMVGGYAKTNSRSHFINGHSPSQPWAVQSLTTASSPSLSVSSSSHDAAVFGQHVSQPSFPTETFEECNNETASLSSSVSQSMDGWSAPPHLTHAAIMGPYYSTASRDMRPQPSLSFPYSAAPLDSSSSSSASFSSTTTTTDSFYGEPISVDGERNYYGEPLQFSASDHAPLEQPTTQANECITRMRNTSRSSPRERYNRFGSNTHRLNRPPPVSRSPPTDRSSFPSKVIKQSTLGTDFGYIKAQDGSYVPVKQVGDFKRGTSGRWISTNEDSRRHRCELMYGDEQCSRSFKRIEHLRRHMRTHTQEQPFACGFAIKRVEYGVEMSERCYKFFQRNDNCVAHFKTHIIQTRDGLYFPDFQFSQDYVQNVSNESIVELAERLHSGSQHSNWKKGSRNPRVPWEEFLGWLKHVKSPKEVRKTTASVLKSCLRDDCKRRFDS